MTRIMHWAAPVWRNACLSPFLLIALHSTELAAKDLYKYRDAQGIEWITDHAMPANAYSYIGRYGRPTAMAPSQTDKAGLIDRLTSYQPLIKRYAGTFSVDPLLVAAVIRTESGFNARAVSKVGAKGLMQLMPYTAAELGVDDSFDPDQNIRGGVKYLSKMLRRFSNNTELALAAYNAGPGAVERYGGIPPFPETRSYVMQVKAHYQHYSAERL